jgi:hypothetical protein
MYMDSAGRPIAVGVKVKFRGKEYHIKEFKPGEGMHGTARIIFDEPEVHTDEVPCETNVDIVE